LIIHVSKSWFFVGKIILMDKQQALGLLDAHRDRLHDFSVKALFLFGSGS
jgi:hypothetical protein